MIVKNVEKKENNTALFTVQADAAEFEKAVNGAYLKNKSSIYIPGFRKGKAPRAVVEGMYGSEVFYQDALDELAPAAFEKGLEESGLRMVGSPAISDVKVNDDKSADFTFEIKLYPEVTLGQYKGLSAEKPVVDVDESEVERELEKQRKQNARQISVDDRAAQMGDVVNIDFDGFLDGERFDGGKAEGYSLELGSNSFVPGFEDQVAGMQIGEEKDLNITFPVDYAENLAGKDVVFKVKLNSISVPELPELDDEFAKDVSEFDTLEEYKADVRAKLVKNADEQADNSFRNLVMKKAVDSMSADVPDVMIKDKAEEIIRNYAANFGLTDRSMPIEKLTQMMGLDSELMNQSILPSAEFQVRSDLLLEAVIKAEELEASEEELAAYAEKVAGSVGAPVEQVKQYFGEEMLKNELLKEKAQNLIFDSAVPEEPKAEEKAEEEKAE